MFQRLDVFNQTRSRPQPGPDEPIAKAVDFTQSVEEVNERVMNNVEALRLQKLRDQEMIDRQTLNIVLKLVTNLEPPKEKVTD